MFGADLISKGQNFNETALSNEPLFLGLKAKLIDALILREKKRIRKMLMNRFLSLKRGLLLPLDGNFH